MTDISNLLKEAKPLYFARKRRNNTIKATLAMLICVLGISFLYPQQVTYYGMDNEEIYATLYGSVIEDMGLPVDEYGLVMVL